MEKEDGKEGGLEKKGYVRTLSLELLAVPGPPLGPGAPGTRVTVTPGLKPVNFQNYFKFFF